MAKTKYLKTDEIFIVTTRLGYIPALRTYGPIPHPIRVPLATCLELIVSGITIHQFDPETKNIVELTMENLFDIDKFTVVEKTEDVVKPVIEETQVAGVVLESAQEEAPVVEEAIADEGPATDEVEEEEAPVVEPVKEAAPVEKSKNNKNRNK